MASMIALHDFMKLFKGNETTRGVFLPENRADENGKEKGKCLTESATPTDQDYLMHLDGKKGLGIVPIRGDAKCFFGALDIDDRKEFPLIPPILKKYGFPLVPFRSKSGGLHLYLFFEEPVLSKSVIHILQEYRRALGLNEKTEVFPKQAKLENGALGNWINLPYFNHDATTRYMLDKDGNPAGLNEALDHCMSSRAKEEDLLKHIEALPLSDAPPCLQGIYIRGYTAMRNNYLFSQGVYLKAKHGDDFEQKLMEVNNALEAPLPVKEVSDTIISSIKKKEYAYKCNEAPICDRCEKGVCKKRKYGIGSAEVPELSYEALIQYTADPPYYEWTVNAKPLRFYTEMEIINQMSFRTLCFRVLHVLPIRLKDDTWTRIVNTALTNIQVVTVDQGDDISVGTMFKEYLSEFLTKRAYAANKEQILMDRVYKDEELGAYVFKSKNLVNFLVIQKMFRAFGQTEIQARLRDMGGVAIRYYVNKQNSTVRVWSVPYKALDTFVEADIDSIDVNFMEAYENEQY